MIEPVAIVGLGLRFPQDADTVEGFWKMLVEGRSAMTEVPGDRWNVDAFYHPDPNRHDATHARGAHFLKDDIATFDAPFFSIPPSEAACIDPQQRMLLECTYQAIENSGMPMDSVKGTRTSVYVGAFANEYEHLLLKDTQTPAKYFATGVGVAMLANRLSWFYDLQGPSITLNTACSSGLCALHLAVKDIQSGEADMAIAGAANFILNPEMVSIPLSNLGFTSEDSISFAFDDRANGYSRGEGVAVLVLKSLRQALRDNDPIRAIIRGTASNQDGRTPVITQPSGLAQERLLREVYQRADLDPAETGYFEAHGTGTKVGDPIESKAISNVFKDRKGNEPLFVGAVKTNIGHLEGCSGIAGVIKTVLILERGIIPPNVWMEKPNPAITDIGTTIQFPQKPHQWLANVRRASVNSFGYGGANAHVILEEATAFLESDDWMRLETNIRDDYSSGSSTPGSLHAINETLYTNDYTNGLSPNHQINGMILKQTQKLLNGHVSDGSKAHTNGIYVNGITKQFSHLNNKITHKKNPSFDTSETVPDFVGPKLFVFSAADESGVTRLRESYLDYFKNLEASQLEKISLDDLAYTLSRKRSSLAWKSYAIASSVGELRQSLESETLSKPVRSFGSTQVNLAFVFTGQGAQWYAMGRELLTSEVFHNSLQQSQRVLDTLGCPWNIEVELSRSKAETKVNNASYSQALCTILQIGLVDLLRSFDITPAAVVGHSSGEIAAAYCSGALSHNSAVKVAYLRGVCASQIVAPAGSSLGMMAVSRSPSEFEQLLLAHPKPHSWNKISVGCINSPKNITLTGDSQQLSELKEILDAEGIFARKLAVEIAYHSPFMAAISQAYLESMGQLQEDDRPEHNTSKIVIWSSVTGHVSSRKELCSPGYWVRNLLEQVKFSEALEDLCTNMTELLRVEEDSSICLVEVGPHAALRRPIQDILRSQSSFSGINYASVLVQDKSALLSAFDVVGSLHCAGYNIDLVKINSPRQQNLRVLSGLPSYPFNHSQRYWIESKLSENFRFRKFARHDLLGLPDLDANSLNAKWRNVIRVSENPWVLDHTMSGTAMYPAAGQLVMAIEAVRQLASQPQNIAYVQLSEVSFIKPLIINSDDQVGTETRLHLQATESNNDTHLSYTFNIYMYSNGDWTETCHGTVAAEISQKEDVDRQTIFAQCKRLGDEITSWAEVTPKDMYENLNEFGVGLGPYFQNLKRTQFDNHGHGSALLNCSDINKKIDAPGATQDYLIHPLALDCLLQVPFLADSKGTWEAIPTKVPSKLTNLYLSGDMAKYKTSPDAQLRLFSYQEFKGYRDSSFTLAAYDNDSNDCLIYANTYTATAVSGLDTSLHGFFNHKQLYSQIHWQPDPDLARNEQITTYLNAVPNDRSDAMKVAIESAEHVCFYYMAQALKALDSEQLLYANPTVQSYVAWAKNRLSLVTNLEVFLAEKLTADLESFPEGPEKSLTTLVGRHLEDFLTEKLDPLEVILQSNLLLEYYSAYVYTLSNEKVASYLRMATHKDPTLKILEVGAGTGSLAQVLLDQLAPNPAAPNFSKYSFTDITPGFLSAAQEKFQQYAGCMDYNILDLEKDPLTQGFEPHSYDIVIASSVIHAVSDINHALESIRKLLAPGGRFILIEPSNPNVNRVSFIFGLLPGWWLATEQERANGPLLADEQWQMALQKAGFASDIMVSPDLSGDAHTLSVIVSKVETENITSDTTGVSILIHEDSKFQLEVARLIGQELSGSPHCTSWSILPLNQINAEATKRSCCIVLAELDDTYLANMDAGRLETIRQLSNTATQVIWLTRGREKEPKLGLITGLARVLMNENPDLTFIDLALQDGCSAETIASHTNNVFVQSATNNAENFDLEYKEEGGMLHVSRLAPSFDLDQQLDVHTHTQKPVPQTWTDTPQRSLELAIETPGLLNTLHFQNDDMSPQLAATEVEISVKATGVNFKDVVVAMGHIAADCLGLEGSGVVTRVGDGVTGFKQGDRVIFFHLGSYKTIVRAEEQTVVKLPAHLSFAEGAALPIVFGTVIHSLANVANLRKGERILIHSGAGGVGQAAIQYALSVGANVYTTVGSQDKKDRLLSLYPQLNADQICISRGAAFEPWLKQRTTGIDVVLNSYSGAGLRRSLECLAPFGRFVDLSKTDAMAFEKLSMATFGRNITYASVDLALIWQLSKPLVHSILTSMIELLNKGHISAATPLEIFPPSNIEQAFRSLQSGKSMGKTVICYNDEDSVLATPQRASKRKFDTNATYLLVGGLGGLGRSIATWMVDCGARNLILLGRSGIKDMSAQQFVDALSARGVQVKAPACDITVESSLMQVLKDCSSSMPPIKGCIQGSMVLNDAAFEMMTLEAWRGTLLSKVDGTLNLDKHLPMDMDFFVLLSSAAGIVGSRGQGNYASANTFQDALAVTLSHTGRRRCVSLNLGLVTGIGFAAVNMNNIGSVRQTGFIPILEAELHSMLNHLCNPDLVVKTATDVQLVTGIDCAPASGPVNGMGRGGNSGGHGFAKKPFFRQMVRAGSTTANTSSEGQSSDNSEENYGSLIASAESEAEAAKTVTRALRQKLAKALWIPDGDIEVQKPIHTFGVDSLVAIELRYWMVKELQAEVSIFDIMGNHTSIVALGALIAGRTRLRKSSSE